MTRRTPKASLPSPAELNRTARDLVTDLRAIMPMYVRLHSLGCEPPRGESVHTSGSGNVKPDGSVTGYPPELAVESNHAASRREYARWVADELHRMARRVDRIRQGLERNVGPTPGFRQSESIGSDAIVSMDQFSESLEKQAARLKAGNE